MHADLVIGHVEFSLQARHHVVGVQNSVLRGLGDTLLAEGQHVGQRLDADVKVAVEHLHAADGLFGIVKAIRAVLFHNQGTRHVFPQEFLAADCASAGAAAAVRGRKGLVQVGVDAVEAHIAGTDNAHDSVQVCAVVVAKAARVVDDLRDLEDVRIEDADGVGVREHQTCRIGADSRTQRVEVNAALVVRLDVDDLIAAHGSRRGVRAVGRVGNDDLRSGRVAAVGVIGLDKKNTGKLAVRACCGLEGDSVHAEHFAKLRAEDVERFQSALRGLDGLQRM